MGVLKYHHSYQLLHRRKPILTYSSKHRVKSILRPLVTNIIDNSKPPDLGVSEFQDLIDPEHSILMRVLWFLIITLCFLICSYQIFHSVKLFLSYPAAVDIYVGERTSFYVPSFSITSGENKYVVKLMGKVEDPLDCFLPLKSVLKRDNIDYKKVWHNDGPSYTYDGYDFLSRIGIDNISVTTKINAFGQETVIGNGLFLTGKELNVIVRIKIKKGKLCTPSFSMASFMDKMDFRVALWTVSGYAFHVIFGTRNYKFLNTPKQACWSNEEYEKCYHRCVAKQHQEGAKCKLPYFPPEVNLPDCTNATSAGEAYITTLSIYGNPDIIHRCNCIRTCKGESYVVQPDILRWNESEGLVIFKAFPYDVGFTERLSYDLSNLLSDIGGNLGLFLGLSLLSILNIGCVIGRTFLKNCAFKADDYGPGIARLRRQVVRYYKYYIKKCSMIKKIHQKPSYSSTINFLKSIVTVACVSLAVYMIQERVRYYLTYPIRKIVDVEAPDVITFPSYTICGTGEKLVRLKRHYAAAMKNMTWCDVDMLDLMGGKKPLSVEAIWKKSEAGVVPTVAALLESALGIKAIQPIYSRIPTHQGQCTHFKSNQENYTGFLTLSVAAYSLSSVHECQNNYFIVYYDDLMEDGYNILTRMEAPISAQTFFDYRLTIVTRINNKYHACVDKELHKKCKHQCLIEQLQRQTTLCKLPFLTLLKNLTECKTPDMAKQTRETYVKILVGVTLGKTCKCIIPCKENVISINVYAAVQDPRPFILAFFMLSNIIENIIEVENYSLIALFGDIGNCLGLAVGLSVLTAAKNFRKLVYFIVNGVKKFVVKLY